MNLLQLSLNQATVENAPTTEFLAACQAVGVRQVGLWRHKYVNGDARTTRARVDHHGLVVSSVCRGGFFTGTRSEQEAIADNQRAIEEAAILGAPILVLVCGPVIGGDFAAAEEAISRGIERILPAAKAAGVTLAVEPFHPMMAAERSAIVTLAQANRILQRFPDPALSLVVDTYHVWWDPAWRGEIAAAVNRIAAVHVADWLVPTENLLHGRGLPGDGVIPLAALLAAVDDTGFSGPVEVEVLNAEIWARPTQSLVSEVCQRMSRILAESARPPQLASAEDLT